MKKAPLLAATAAIAVSSGGFADKAIAQTVSNTGSAPSVANPNSPETRPSTGASGNKNLFGQDEIVVTARKRNESLQDVPISVTAFGEQFLKNYQVTNLQTIANFTPALVVGSGNTGLGGTIYLRGVGSNIDSPLVDNAVAINVDDVQVGGQILRASFFDMGQVQVFRGPQALFFGKNSPGGVVALTSAKPTKHLYVRVTAGYEFTAREKYLEGVVSGPITDTLGIRVAGRYSAMDGYFKFKSIVVPGESLGASMDRGPNAKDGIGKIGLEWDPTSRFDAHANFTYSKYTTDVGVILQRSACPAGVAQTTDPIFATIEDCKVNDTVVIGDLTPAVLAVAPKYTKNEPLGYIDSTQYLASLVGNYHVTNQITLTSVSGYYDASDESSTIFSIEPNAFVSDSPWVHLKQFTQEFRLATSFGGIADATLGGFYEKSETFTDFVLTNPPIAPGVDLHENADQHRTVWSGFGQAILRPVADLEITGGVRYTWEKKDTTFISNAVPGVTARAAPTFSNWSPEATIRYEPSKRLNFYASFKEGFKSGGLNAGTSVTTAFVASGGTLDISYAPEKVRGFEGGVKFNTADQRVTGSVAAFDYGYKGLQLQAVDPQSNYTILVQNAAAARVKGLEGDINYRPAAIRGLTLYGNGAYVHARYTNFIADCYTGQAISQGCDLVFDPVLGRYTKQNLSGTPLKTAPDWSGTLGFDYSVPMNKFQLDIGANVFYASKMRVDNVGNPSNVQPSYATLNGSIRLSTPGEQWQLALIGENLTNQFVMTAANQDFVSGNATTSPYGTPVAYKVDQFANVNRGRVIRLQLTFQFP